MSQSPYYLSTSRSADSAPRTPPHNFLHDDVAIASSDVDDPHSVDIDGLELPQPSIEGGLTLDPINERIAKEEQGRNFNDVFDPLLLAAIAAASGPHTTRHHYHHHYLRNDGNSKGDAWETSVNTSEDEDDVRAAGTTYNNKEGIHSRVSHAKAQTTINASEYKETQTHVLEDTSLPNSGASTPELTYSRSLSDSGYLTDLNHSAHTSVDKRAWHPASDESFETETRTKGTNLESTALFDNTKTEPVDVKCMVRARIPTPYGEAFLHLYHNSRDAKEHLAIVVDPAQLTPEDSNLPAVPHIRSKSLDAVWSRESEKDRIVRGAYVGRLSAETRDASASDTSEARFRFTEAASDYVIPPPLVRIHSECFTGETIGSLRCDCGEQLDEALRLIFQPQTIHSRDGSIRRIIPGRGAVIYMRQEGRGIGLLEKLRAYNLQDLGHDTVAANLLLGRGADERRYDVAGAILKDLGLGSEEEGVRLLTNNPDKVSALEIEGVRVTERVPMVPRSWRSNSQSPSPMAHSSELFGLSFHSHGNHDEYEYVMGGATQIGGFTTGAAVVRGTDLDKYLRTKVLKMGHMLSLPPSSTSPI